MGKVLFCSHAAERTGPPIIMLHLARWLRSNTDLDFELLFLRGGDLEAEFRSLAPVWILDEWELPRWATVLESALWKFGLERHAPKVRTAALRRRLSDVVDVDLIYVNTCGSVRAARYLRDQPPFITHVHELSVGLEHHLPAEDHDLIAQRTRHYIAVSEAVSDATVSSFGVDPIQVTVQYGFVDARRVPSRRDLVADLGLPPGTPVVGAAGLTHWRKAPDLFVQIARVLDRDHSPEPEPHFVWVGGERDGPELEAVRYDVAHCGLSERVHFLGHLDDPLPTIAAFDVLVLPAREDAFPLVCLEAASVGVPIVCFDNGGMPEFVGDGECGFVAPYADIDAMAGHVARLLTDQGLRDRLGAQARRRAVDVHDIPVGAAGIHRTVRRWL